MPKIMRERVKRDRANVEKIAAMQGKLGPAAQEEAFDQGIDQFKQAIRKAVEEK